MLALGLGASAAEEGQPLPIGWAKWSAEEPWFPVYGWTPPDRRIEPAVMPYAVVACYEHQAV
jgi:hypothetical protein